MIKTTLALIIGILFLVGIILLQIFLSKRENKWFGLILPIISAIFSSIPLLLIPVSADTSIIQRIILASIIVLLCNIPTGILLTIYFACREKLKKNKEIDKMNIQDLH